MNHAMPRFVLHCFTLFCLCFGLMIPFAAHAAQDIGQVISLVPGASVLRNGKTEDLAPHSGIRVSDTVRTDASGRVKILFNDDGSLSLGPNTAIDMNEYADAGSAPAFGVHLTHGLARVITGKIVDQNPGGFKMTAPLATVGIRGTIFAIRVVNEMTTIYVEHGKLLVNGIEVTGGFKIILLPDGTWLVEPITAQDRRELGQDLALRGGAGTAAAAPEPTEQGGQPSAADQIAAGERNFLSPNNTLQEVPLVTQNLGDSLASAGPIVPAGPTVGQVTGTLSSPSLLSSGNNSFSFAVNLTSGAISNGNINITQDGALFGPGAWSASLSGGAGLASSSGFTMNASGWSYYQGVPADPGAAASIAGGADLLSAPTLYSFPVTYGVTFDTAGTISDTGTGVGLFTK